MKFTPYTPEFIIYPAIFVFVLIIGVMMARGKGTASLGILIAWSISWLIIYVILSIFTTMGIIPQGGWFQ